MIRGLIEGAVIGHRQGPSKLNELLRSLDINLPVFPQDTQHHSVQTALFHCGNSSLHFRELCGRIDEVPPAWTDHHNNGDKNLFLHSANQASAGCDAAERQSTAEFDAVRAAALCRQCRFNSLNADFEDTFPVHVRSPAAGTTCVSVLWVQFQHIPRRAAAFQPHKKRRICLGV